MTDAQPRPAWATLISRLREDAKLTQKVLAESAGISLGHMGMIETGSRTPSPETLAQIADALGIKGKQRQDLLEAVPRPERPMSIPERLTRLEDAFAELVERLGDLGAE